ncbi:Protein pitchfork [Vulpes lagopus]
MCFGKAESLVNYPFGISQPRKLFPHHHPPSLLGNKFLPLRGAPHRGPGCYIAEDVHGLAYNLSKIPTSKKGYTFGARTAERFKTINKSEAGRAGGYQKMCPEIQEKYLDKSYEEVYLESLGVSIPNVCESRWRVENNSGKKWDMMLYPSMYQAENPQEQIHKQNFAPFNAFLPRFRTSKDTSNPGPGTYNPEMKPPPKIIWPMKFGSPDWAQVPCLQKRTLKAELSTDKDFRKHRNRVAYLSLFYS